LVSKIWGFFFSASNSSILVLVFNIVLQSRVKCSWLGSTPRLFPKTVRTPAGSESAFNWMYLI
jgi:hypothetical protein